MTKTQILLNVIFFTTLWLGCYWLIKGLTESGLPHFVGAVIYINALVSFEFLSNFTRLGKKLNSYLGWTVQ